MNVNSNLFNELLIKRFDELGILVHISCFKSIVFPVEFGVPSFGINLFIMPLLSTLCS